MSGNRLRLLPPHLSWREHSTSPTMSPTGRTEDSRAPSPPRVSSRNRRGARAFIEVGLALAEIRDRRFYRERFATFQECCQGRFQISRAHGYRLIAQATAIVEMHSLSPIGDNLVFIGLAPAWFVRARQEDMRQARFALVELCALPIPPGWPQFGIELAAGWAPRGWQGGTAHTRLLEEPPGR